MPKHILFACDLSESSRALFPQLLTLATPFRSRVTLLYAMEFLASPMVRTYGVSFANHLEKLEQAMEENALQHLEKFKNDLDMAELENEIVLAHGDPGVLIVEQAQSSGSDMIVMGSRGFGPVKSALLGSVSTFVLHHSPCPVLILPVAQA